MSKTWLTGIALILFLVPFPLISIGTTEGQETLWLIGLALIGLAGLVPPITRFAFENGDEENGEED